MKSLIVVGAGLAGLYAAILASSRGSPVRLVAEGRGGLSLSHGCIDTWKDGDVRLGSTRLAPDHPLRAIGHRPLQAALAAFLEITTRAKLPYVFDFDKSLHLPSPLGTIHTCAAAPRSLAGGHLADPTPFHLGDLAQVRDFSAALVASGLRHRGIPFSGTLALPMPVPSTAGRPDLLTLARALEDPAFRESTCNQWAPHLQGVERLGIPACLGLDRSGEVFDSMRSRLGVDLFEIPTLPPSLPGLRLERALRREAARSGVELIEGPSVRGEVDGRSGGRRVSGVVATTAGGPRVFRADAVVLATGGPLHGGWLTFGNGEVQESVFGLPIHAPEARERWTESDPFASQPYARFGLRIDDRSRPIDIRGRPYFENLFAAGGLLAGADRAVEGSRQGIDLGSAFVAIEAALA